MNKGKDYKIQKNKVDKDKLEAIPLAQVELKIIREHLTQDEMCEIKIQQDEDQKKYIPKYDELMSKEEMMEQANKEFNSLPNRKILNHDQNILKEYIFTDELIANSKTELDPFKIELPAENMKFQDLTLNDEDFAPNIQHLEDLYFKDKIEKIQNWEIHDNKFKDGSRKNVHVSQFLEVKQTSERYLISYQIENRKRYNEYAVITQCHIYKYNEKKNKFLILHSFLAEINTKGSDLVSGRPQLFNRVFINREGIFYLTKNEFLDENGQKACSIIVNHIQFEQQKINVKGFNQLKQDYSENDEQFKIKQAYSIQLNTINDMEDFDLGFGHHLDLNSSIQDQFIFIYQYEYAQNKEFRIYSLKDQSEPIVQYSQPLFVSMHFAFVFKDFEERLYFIIKTKSANYEIKKEGHTKLVLDKQSSKDFIKSSNEYFDFLGRYFDQQVTVEKLRVKLSEQEQVDQYYFINYLGYVIFIHPFHEDEERREKIEDYIINHHSIQREKGIVTFLNQSENRYLTKSLGWGHMFTDARFDYNHELIKSIECFDIESK